MRHTPLDKKTGPAARFYSQVCYQNKRGQSGAALLMAMLIVALVTTLAAAAMWQQWRGVEVEAAERSRVQSVWLLTGGLDWSRLILRQDALSAPSNEYDHFGEPWAMPLSESRLSTFLSGTPGAAETDDTRNAFLSGSITDLQSRMNIGNLVAGGQLSLGWRLRFERLFSALNLPSGELTLLVQGMEAAYPKKGSTASSDAALPPTQMDQLVWFGLSPSTIEALKPHAALISVRQTMPVNLNTASAEVIYATGIEEPTSTTPKPSGMSMTTARALVEHRNSKFFRDMAVARFTAETMGSRDFVTEQWFSIKSNHFEVRGRLRLDDLALEELSTLKRDGRNVTISSRRRTTVTTPEPGGLDYTSLQGQFGQ